MLHSFEEIIDSILGRAVAKPAMTRVMLCICGRSEVNSSTRYEIVIPRNFVIYVVGSMMTNLLLHSDLPPLQAIGVVATIPVPYMLTHPIFQLGFDQA